MEIEEYKFRFDLILIELVEYDVILGMDLLSTYRVTLDLLGILCPRASLCTENLYVIDLCHKRKLLFYHM